MLFASQQDFAREFTLWEITSVGYYRKVQRTFTQTWKHSRHKAFSHLDFDLRILITNDRYLLAREMSTNSMRRSKSVMACVSIPTVSAHPDVNANAQIRPLYIHVFTYALIWRRMYAYI